MMAVGWISLVILMVAIALLIKFIFPGNYSFYKTNLSNNNIALDILKKRFANGEISKEEFEEKKQVLL